MFNDFKTMCPSAAVVLIVSAANVAQAQISIDPAVSLATGHRPDGVAVGDFDGDGDLDLAVATDNNDKINIHLNNGSGVFGAGPIIQLPASSSPGNVRAGDLDADGDQDIAVILRDFNQIAAVRNNGGGSFTLGTPAAVGANARGLTIADIDGDGDLDVAVANRDGNTGTVLRNTGNATFSPQTVAAGAEPRAAAFGRFNGDGLLDLVISNHDSRTLSVLIQARGGFTPLATLSTGGDLRPEGVVAADIDNDGDDDIIAATSDDSIGSRASVFRNLGGSFSAQTTFNTGGLDAAGIAAVDLDCDNLVDVAVTHETSNSLGVLKNLGNGAFGPALVRSTGLHPDEVGAGDFDGDGDRDLATANRDSNTMSIFGNASCSSSATDADINNDGAVNVSDMLMVINGWGACASANCPADIAPTTPSMGDGQVNVSDLLRVLNNWG